MLWFDLYWGFPKIRRTFSAKMETVPDKPRQFHLFPTNKSRHYPGPILQAGRLSQLPLTVQFKSYQKGLSVSQITPDSNSTILFTDMRFPPLESFLTLFFFSTRIRHQRPRHYLQKDFATKPKPGKEDAFRTFFLSHNPKNLLKNIKNQSGEDDTKLFRGFPLYPQPPLLCTLFRLLVSSFYLSCLLEQTLFQELEVTSGLTLNCKVQNEVYIFIKFKELPLQRTYAF